MNYTYEQLQTGIGLRDRGIEKVDGKSHSWQDRAVTVVMAMPGGELMGEDIHRTVEVEVGDPHHQNAWGALIMKLVKLGVLRKTGEYRKSSRPSAHARVNPVYTKD